MLQPNDPILKFSPLWGNWFPEELLGEGSFGRVYRAVRNDSSGTFYSAVKLITLPKSENDYSEALQMGMDQNSVLGYFDNIAQKIAKEISILHTLRGEANIVAYEDHLFIHPPSSQRWDILLRMELLVPLSSYLSNNPFTPDDVRRLGIEICSALETCGAYHVIHRDIKEGNVFLNARGTFKLGDFGIARELTGGSMSMSMRGTPAYIAPEVYRGQHYDATVDIYSLGILLYKLLNNGRYPFLPPAPSAVTLDDTESAFARRMRGDIPPLPAHGSRPLQEAVLMACEFDPRERFQSATAFKRALNFG